MRRKKRKKGLLFCCIVLALAIFFIRTIVEHKANNAKSSAASAGLSVLSYKKGGSISYDENQYFQKYIISCKKDITDINKKEDKNSIYIYLNKKDITSIHIDSGDKQKTKGISADSAGGTIKLAIHKKYNENNFVYIDPLTSKNIVVTISKLKNPYKYKVVLDPGHGGNDKGTNRGTLYEKDITLKIADYMPELLRYNGCSVIFTRETDKWTSIKTDIPNTVNKSGADAFVSIHVNSFTDSRYSGIGVYFYDPDGYQKEEREKLSTMIQDEVVKSDGWYNRGITRDRLYILKVSKIPCALVECGFMSNPDDRKRLTDHKVLKRLADNIDTGIIKFLNDKKGK